MTCSPIKKSLEILRPSAARFSSLQWRLRLLISCQFVFEPFRAAHVRRIRFLIGFDSAWLRFAAAERLQIFQLFSSPVWTGGRDKRIESAGAQLNKQQIESKAEFVRPFMSRANDTEFVYRLSYACACVIAAREVNSNK